MSREDFAGYVQGKYNKIESADIYKDIIWPQIVK